MRMTRFLGSIAAGTIAACAYGVGGGSSSTGVTPTTFPDAGVNLDGGVDPATLPKFSFFVTSLKGLQEISGSQTGFGGDLRFGQVGAGAGLRGADAICAANQFIRCRCGSRVLGAHRAGRLTRAVNPPPSAGSRRNSP
jgi:hypothetical protein